MSLTLPLEIYYRIISHVGIKSDLYSLALTSSAFHDEAQRRLFSDAEPESLDQQERFFQAIDSAPLRLGPLVHSLYISEWGPRDYVQIISLRKALQAMSGLKHLNVQWREPASILKAVTFELQTLVCPLHLTQAEVSRMVYDFLPTQKDIKHLEFLCEGSINLPQPPIDLCPQLESLTANSLHLVQALLPNNRLIKKFEWLDSNMPPPLTIRQLNRLKSLKFSVRHPLRMDTSFTTHLASLIDLWVSIQGASADQLSRNWLHFLPNIPHLQHLVIDLKGLHVEVSDSQFYLTFFNVIERAFKDCTELQHIDGIYTNTSGTTKLLRLVRQTPTETNVLHWKVQSRQLNPIKEWRYVTPTSN